MAVSSTCTTMSRTIADLLVFPLRVCPCRIYAVTSSSPNYGITVTPFEGVQLFAKYSSGYRPPSIRESTWNSSGFYFNPDLKPEHQSNWEFGANYLGSDLLEPDDKLRIKLAYFDNETDGLHRPRLMAKSRRTSSTGLAKLYNFDSVTLRGVEFTASYDARKFFASTSLNYYTDFIYCRTAATCGSAAQQSDYMVNQVPPKFTASDDGGHSSVRGKADAWRAPYVRRRERRELFVGLIPTTSIRLTLLPWPQYHLFDLFAEWKYTEEVPV